MYRTRKACASGEGEMDDPREEFTCVYRTRKACALGEGEMDDLREELCVQNKEGMCLGRGGRWTEQGRHVPRERGEMDDPREELCVQNKEGMCLGRGGDG